MAQKAFARTAAYDAAISNWLGHEIHEPAPKWRAFGGVLHPSYGALRYGENPHQHAALYLSAEARPGVATARQVQGKALSYNNINDTDAAVELTAEFDPASQAAVAIIKHANPCGCCSRARSPTRRRPVKRSRASPAASSSRRATGPASRKAT